MAAPDRTQRLEKINLMRLGYLLKKGSEHPLIKIAENRLKAKKQDPAAFDPVLDHAKKLFNQVVHVEGTEYGFLTSKFKQPHGDAGRLNAVGNMSLQVTSKFIRHAISENKSGSYYRDIDQVNSHVVLLANYCRKNRIRHSMLKVLIENREKVLAEVMDANHGVSREQVKKVFLSLLNGGKNDYFAIKNKTDTLKKFHAEINDIIHSVAVANPKLLEQVVKKRENNNRDFNHEGAVINRILQDLENKCLKIMEQVFVEKGFHLQEIIPIHDGMQVPVRDGIDDELPEILKECEERIEYELDIIGMKLAVKPMDAHLTVENAEFPDETPENINSYCGKSAAQNIEKFNPFDSKNDFYDVSEYYRGKVFNSLDTLGDDARVRLPAVVRAIQYPPRFIINKGMRYRCHSNDPEHVIDLEKIVNMNFYYMKEVKVGPMIFYEQAGVTFHELMRLAPKVEQAIPVYKTITFEPNLAAVKPGMFNMFHGFKAREVDVVDMTLIQPILNHIMTCWCGDNADIFDYITQWFRQAFAEPWKKIGVVILLYGDEGAGKGILLDEFIRPLIYGFQNSVILQGLSKIVQRFNSVLMDKLLVCSNEVNSNEGFHDTFDTLKALITDKTFCPEKKGLDVFTDYPIPCNFIFTTNNHDSVKLGKTDRRYLCLETSSRHKNNFDYFDQLDKSFTQEVADHFYTYIKRLPKKRNLRNIPMTPLKEEMLSHSRTSFDLFWKDVCDSVTEAAETRDPNLVESAIRLNGDDRIGPLFVVEWDNMYVKVGAFSFYEAYKQWCGIAGEKVKAQRDFAREMKRLAGFKKTKNRFIYLIPIIVSQNENNDEETQEVSDEPPVEQPCETDSDDDL
jgi:hypothetical protein